MELLGKLLPGLKIPYGVEYFRSIGIEFDPVTFAKINIPKPKIDIIEPKGEMKGYDYPLHKDVYDKTEPEDAGKLIIDTITKGVDRGYSDYFTKSKFSAVPFPPIEKKDLKFKRGAYVLPQNNFTDCPVYYVTDRFMDL